MFWYWFTSYFFSHCSRAYVVPIYALTLMKLFFKVLPTLPPHDLNIILARFLSPGCHVEHSKRMDGKELGTFQGVHIISSRSMNLSGWSSKTETSPKRSWTLLFAHIRLLLTQPKVSREVQSQSNFQQRIYEAALYRCGWCNKNENREMQQKLTINIISTNFYLERYATIITSEEMRIQCVLFPSYHRESEWRWRK